MAISIAVLGNRRSTVATASAATRSELEGSFDNSCGSGVRRRGALVAHRGRVRGFSLVETLAALVILASALLALAPLMTMAAGANGEARHLTTATLLALDKIEELRSGSLVASPLDALDRNAPGFFDAFDAAGAPLGAAGAAVPAGAAFVRRWTVAGRGGPPSNHAAIQVTVLPGTAATSRVGISRYRGEVRLAALIARVP